MHNGNHGVFRRLQIRYGLIFVGSSLDVTHDPTLELPVVFDVDLAFESVQLDFGAGRAFVPAGRPDLTESFCGNGSSVFSNAVIAEDHNQLVREDAGNDAPIHLVDAHEKIGDQYTDIRSGNISEVHKDTAIAQNHFLQCDLIVFQKIETNFSLFDFAGDIDVGVTE
jgi:hypothetical protein